MVEFCLIPDSARTCRGARADLTCLGTEIAAPDKKRRYSVVCNYLPGFSPYMFTMRPASDLIQPWKYLGVVYFDWLMDLPPE